MVARGGPIREANQDSEAARRVLIGLSRSESIEPPTRGFSTQKVGVKQVNDKIWLVSYMQYDLGYFDHETCRLEHIETHAV